MNSSNGPDNDEEFEVVNFLAQIARAQFLDEAERLRARAKKLCAIARETDWDVLRSGERISLGDVFFKATDEAQNAFKMQYSNANSAAFTAFLHELIEAAKTSPSVVTLRRFMKREEQR